MTMRRLTILLLPLLIYACTSESYDTGDGDLSFMRADFADLYTNGNARLAAAMTDDGDSLRFEPPVSQSWATTPDSAYRALIYYNKVGQVAELRSVATVAVPRVRAAAEMKRMPQDPLTLESAWRSANGRYVNLSLLLQHGQTDEQTRHTISVVCDTVETRQDGGRTVRLRLLHDQNGIPDHYTVQTYVSIPVARLPISARTGDEVSISVVTHQDTICRSFAL